MKRFAIVLTVFAAAAAYCCTLAIVGVFPSKLVRLSGTVVGSDDFRLANDKAARQRTPVAGATVTVRTRDDKKIFDPKGYDKKMKKRYLGSVSEWTCSEVKASTVTDKNGHFELDLAPLKYCVEFIDQRPVSDAVRHPPMQEEFLVDVDPQADRDRELLADISPLWADCSGGSEIKVVNAPSH